MGLFDTILVPCPKCSEKMEFQTKSGDCSLRSFDLVSAPKNMMKDVNRHAPYKCSCGAEFQVKIKNKSVKWLNPEKLYTFTKEELDYEFNLILNKALCLKGRIQKPNSNNIAEFIIKYMNDEKI